MPKKRLERSEIPGESFFIDISSPKTKRIEGYQNLLLCVDDCTDIPFSFFISEKSQLEEVVEPFFVHLKNTYDIIVKIVRCDNAGENRSFEKTCKSEGHGIKFEYTDPCEILPQFVLYLRFPCLFVHKRY